MPEHTVHVLKDTFPAQTSLHRKGPGVEKLEHESSKAGVHVGRQPIGSDWNPCITWGTARSRVLGFVYYWDSFTTASQSPVP